MSVARAPIAALAALTAFIAPALAQVWPAKTVRVVVPFPAGGSTDIIGRLMAQKLGEGLGQQFIVDNRGGAGGTIGSELAAKAPPDGYTLLVGTSSTHAIAPGLYPRLAYEPTRDFAPVSLLCTATILLAVHPSIPARNVKELIALARRAPDQLTFASGGNGSISHLVGEHFKAAAGVRMVHVPYKGDTPALIDLVAGQVSLEFGTAVAFLPYIKSGKLVALAVTNPQRSPVVPQTPTVSESGLPGIEALQWFGIYAPANTPRDVLGRLHGEIVRVLKQPDVRERMASLGTDVVGSSPDEFAAFNRAEIAKWAKIVKISGARVE